MADFIAIDEINNNTNQTIENLYSKLLEAMATTPRISTFTTPGNYSIEIPYGVTKVLISACGAGGGGGGASYQNVVPDTRSYGGAIGTGAGGGGGTTNERTITISNTETI